MESEAKVSDEIAFEAAQVEARMQTVCEYNLSDDPEISDILAHLRGRASPGNLLILFR
jgi:Mn-containing catalase